MAHRSSPIQLSRGRVWLIVRVQAMSDLRVYLRPDFAGPDNGEGGIRRWVEAQKALLPALGIEFVEAETLADVVVCHAADIVNTTKPLVVHNHGLYNTAAQPWDKWAWQMNRNCIELLRRADIATVPSRWVADQMARGLSLNARVLYAGIDPEQWEPDKSLGYVLWNKTRVDAVCDPMPVNVLARGNTGLSFVSTYGEAGLHNLTITGKLPFEGARTLIRRAGVYLSTSRETFGIGTIEAMAAGVPVLGFDFGGNLDIVEHGATGYLAKAGDYDDLQRGLETVLAKRAVMGRAARERALSLFTLDAMAHTMASLYREAHEGRPECKVTVLVTCYNLEQYLRDCLDSVERQTLKEWECIVVDDCSPGDTAGIVESYAMRDSRFRYVRTPKNLYLAGARNYGTKQAKGRYIIPLDADDMLGEKALEVLADTLDSQPGYDIAYGAMELLEPDGRRWVSTWPGGFSFENQMKQRPGGDPKAPNMNQLPYCSMYRKALWERTGGYRERCATSEDNDFWCRVTSFGGRPVKATTYPTLIYRNRADSMSRSNEWPDCTLWYPWARKTELMPFGAVGRPANDVSWPVKTYAEPEVSVIIPVGPGHATLVRDALDSVLAQTVDCWEAIVVNDTGEDLELEGFPWAKVFRTASKGSGPAAARNIGIANARGSLLAFLDADDLLMPKYLERTMALQKVAGGYVYTDWWQLNKEGHELKGGWEWDAKSLLYDGMSHTITCLMPKAAVLEVGGFDLTQTGWEDWDLLIGLAVAGYCGSRMPEPLFCYRYYTGERRENGWASGKENAKIMRQKWGKYLANNGELYMGCSSCGKGGGRKDNSAIGVARQQERVLAGAVAEGVVIMEYTGKSAGTQRIRGPVTRTLYAFGQNTGHRRLFVLAADAAKLAQLKDLAIVPTVEATERVTVDEPPQMRVAVS